MATVEQLNAAIASLGETVSAEFAQVRAALEAAAAGAATPEQLQAAIDSLSAVESAVKDFIPDEPL